MIEELRNFAMAWLLWPCFLGEKIFTWRAGWTTTGAEELVGRTFYELKNLENTSCRFNQRKSPGKVKTNKKCSCFVVEGVVEGCWNPTMFISKDANVVWSLSYVLWFHGVGDWKSQGKQCSFPSWKNTRQVGAVKTLVYYTYVFLMLWTYASNP